MEKKNYKRGFWPKERCLEEAKKYSTRKEFGRGAPGAYKASCQQGWLDEICAHMELIQQPRGYWTKERCQSEALKYSTRSEFTQGSRSAYSKAHREGWLDDICSHMIEPTKPNGYWTKERCLKEAATYHTRTAFKDGAPSAYNAAFKHGWLDGICGHMDTKIHKFTKKECYEEAKKYSRRIDFMNKSPHYYSWAIRHGFMKEICSHMEHQGNLHRRKIYVFEFADHHAYVGLAQYPKSRERQHLKEERSAVYKYIQKTGCCYVFKELTDFMDKEDAANAEDEWIKKYADNGWIMINKKPGGDLGYGPQKYTKEFCAEEAMKYQYRVDFKRNNSIIYNYAASHGWLEDICHHMTWITRKPHFWTKEKCINEALKYKSRKLFQKGSSGAYSAALDNGWLDEICSHMRRPAPSNYYWTKERCKEEAAKYETLKDFRKNSYAYNAALKNGWVAEICSHMARAAKPAGYWTKARCIKEARKNKTFSQFRKNCASAYAIAWRNGWLDDIHDKFKEG